MVFKLINLFGKDIKTYIRAECSAKAAVYLEGCDSRYYEFVRVAVNIRICENCFACILGIVVPRTRSRVETACAVACFEGCEISVLSTDVEVKNFRIIRNKSQRINRFDARHVTLEAGHETCCVGCRCPFFAEPSFKLFTLRTDGSTNFLRDTFLKIVLCCDEAHYRDHSKQESDSTCQRKKLLSDSHITISF